MHQNHNDISFSEHYFLCCFSEDWQGKCNEFQKMLIVRSLRQDRVSFCVTSFICKNLGSRFVEPPVLDMNAVSCSHIFLSS